MKPNQKEQIAGSKLTKMQQLQYLKLLNGLSLSGVKASKLKHYLPPELQSQTSKSGAKSQGNQRPKSKNKKQSMGVEMQLAYKQSEAFKSIKNNARQQLRMSDYQAQDLEDRLQEESENELSQIEEHTPASQRVPGTSPHLTRDLLMNLNRNEDGENSAERTEGEDPDYGHMDEEPVLSYVVQSQTREDLLPPTVGSVWDRLQPASKPKASLKQGVNQDLIDMGCLEDEEEPEEQLAEPVAQMKKQPAIERRGSSSAHYRHAAPYRKSNFKLEKPEQVVSDRIEAESKKSLAPQTKALDVKSKFMQPQSRQPRTMSAAGPPGNSQSSKGLVAGQRKSSMNATFCSQPSQIIRTAFLHKNSSQNEIKLQNQTQPAVEGVELVAERSEEQAKQSSIVAGEEESRSVMAKERVSVFERLTSQRTQNQQSVSPDDKIGNDPKTPAARQLGPSRLKDVAHELRQSHDRLTKALKTTDKLSKSVAREKTVSILANQGLEGSVRKPNQEETLHGLTTIAAQPGARKQEALVKTIEQTGKKSTRSPDKTQKAGGLHKKQLLLTQTVQHEASSEGIICSINRVEPYIRRAVARIGWLVQGEKDTSLRFHVKFDVADIDVKLRPHQFYNHFPDNRELTTKAGLCKNLWTICSGESELGVSAFFPRCFDLSDPKQVECFREDFQQTAVMSIVKLYAQSFALDMEIRSLKARYDRKSEFENPKVFKAKFAEELEASEPQSTEPCAARKAVLQAAQLSKGLILHKTLDKHWKNVTRSAKVPGPGTKQALEMISKLAEFHSQLDSQKLQGLESFTKLEKVKILRTHEKLRKYSQQYRNVDGTQNVWVVKPSYSSRGLGIFCTNKFKDIVAEGRKNQSKVVQKYVEAPFLINQRKFDLRQWVLVASWEPLDVFVFDAAYLRLCSRDFSLNDLHDVYKHLSNYSIQRTNENQDATNVMSTDEFQDYLGSESTWRNQIQPKVKSAIYKTLKAIQDTQDTDHKCRCFEVYGFDIMLDQDLNPWVLEVNLSPACSEKRASFLTEMLDDMAFDLVNWLERKILVKSMPEECLPELSRSLRAKRNQAIKLKDYFEISENLNSDEFYEESGLKNRWVRLPECIDDIKQHNLAQQALQALQTAVVAPALELYPQKVDLRHEKKLDVNFRKIETTKFCQRVWRSFKARERCKALRRLYASIVIQKYARRRLAVRQRQNLKLQKCIIKVQSEIRRILAKRFSEKLKAKKIEKAQRLVVTKLGAHHRRYKAQLLLVKLRFNFKALLLQKFMKGLLSKRKMLQLRKFKTLVIRIQRFYKKRYSKMSDSSFTVQKFIKGRKSFVRHQLLLRIVKGGAVLRRTKERHRHQAGLRSFLNHASCIKIQCFWRQIKAIRELKRLQKIKARAQLTEIAQKIRNKSSTNKTSSLLKQVRSALDKKAKYIQTILRKVRALSKLKEVRAILLKQRVATKLQSFVKMRLQKIRYEELLLLRNSKATLIQSWFKASLQRIKYKKAIEALRKQYEQKTDKSGKGRSGTRMSKDRRENMRTSGFSNPAFLHSQEFQEDDDDDILAQGGINQCSEEEAIRLEREICDLIERKAVENFKPKSGRHLKAKSKERKVKSSRQQARGGGSVATTAHTAGSKVERKIKNLEDQFYGRNGLTQKSGSNMKVETLNSCQIQIVKHSPKHHAKVAKLKPSDSNKGISHPEGKPPAKFLSKRQRMMIKEKAQQAVNKQYPQLSFSENLKNLLATSGQSQTRFTNQSAVFSQRMSADNKQARNSANSTKALKISSQQTHEHLDDAFHPSGPSILNSNNNATNNLDNRPLKNPKLDARVNIELKEAAMAKKSHLVAKMIGERDRIIRASSGLEEGSPEDQPSRNQVPIKNSLRRSENTRSIKKLIHTYEPSTYQVGAQRISNMNMFHDSELESIGTSQNPQYNYTEENQDQIEVPHAAMVQDALISNLTVRKKNQSEMTKFTSSIKSKQSQKHAIPQDNKYQYMQQDQAIKMVRQQLHSEIENAGHKVLSFPDQLQMSILEDSCKNSSGTPGDYRNFGHTQSPPAHQNHRFKEAWAIIPPFGSTYGDVLSSKKREIPPIENNGSLKLRKKSKKALNRHQNDVIIII